MPVLVEGTVYITTHYNFYENDFIFNWESLLNIMRIIQMKIKNRWPWMTLFLKLCDLNLQHYCSDLYSQCELWVDLCERICDNFNWERENIVEEIGKQVRERGHDTSDRAWNYSCMHSEEDVMFKRTISMIIYDRNREKKPLSCGRMNCSGFVKTCFAAYCMWSTMSSHPNLSFFSFIFLWKVKRFLEHHDGCKWWVIYYHWYFEKIAWNRIDYLTGVSLRDHGKAGW